MDVEMTDHFRAMKYLAEHLSEEQLQSAADCRLTTVRFGQAIKAIDEAFQAAFDLGYQAAGGEILPLPFLNESPPIQYATAAVEAVQRLLERGKATVDSDGYLRAIVDGWSERWRPISTAPKDATFVLLFGPYGIDLGQYEPNWSPPQWLRIATAEYDNDGATIADPTHWMPLPPPPPTTGDNPHV